AAGAHAHGGSRLSYCLGAGYSEAIIAFSTRLSSDLKSCCSRSSLTIAPQVMNRANGIANRSGRSRSVVAAEAGYIGMAAGAHAQGGSRLAYSLAAGYREAVVAHCQGIGCSNKSCCSR